MNLADLLRSAASKIRTGDLTSAHALLTDAVASDPTSFEALAYLGAVLSMTRRHNEALVVCDRMLALKPRDPDALYNRGLLLLEVGRFDEAVTAFDAALEVRKNFVSALSGRGSALAKLERYPEALADFELARTIEPSNPRISNNYAATLNESGQHIGALATIDAVIARAPQYADAHNTRGTILFSLRRDDDAVKAFNSALALRPEFPDALNNLAQALRRLGLLTEAIDALTTALRLRPDFVEAMCTRGSIAEQLLFQDEAIRFYERALELRPDLVEVLPRLAFCCLATNDWPRFDNMEARLREHPEGIDPYTHVMFGWPQDQQYELISRFVAKRFPTHEAAHRHHPVHHRIRVAYVSSDFREHPIAQLTAGLFDHHDKDRFDIVGISLGPDDRSNIRRRIVDAFDEFHDVRALSDDALAELIRSREIDVAVDLNGYTAMARTAIMATRSAPIQVNYLGQPGTMGAHFIDYIIGDPHVTPFSDQPFYVEKIVQLPHCYLPNESKREIAVSTLSRAEAGLPPDGFVFCCFNNNYKITAAAFDIWMRLLQAVDGSVLWFLRPNDSARRNLQKEAAAHGVNPGRLIFAERVSPADHLARHRLADLFLDTLPYNAHATAADALWMGVPVITQPGATLAGRVATSLLHAVGLPELIADSCTAYQSLAFKIAKDRTLLSELRGKLARNRHTHPLFDTKLYTRHLEAAFTTMVERHRSGEEPMSFAVPALSNVCGRSP